MKWTASKSEYGFFKTWTTEHLYDVRISRDNTAKTHYPYRVEQKPDKCWVDVKGFRTLAEAKAFAANL